MNAKDMPAAEHHIDVALVRGLLAEQFPEFAGGELTEFASGWDSVLFRLGDDHIVRLPRRSASAPLVANEQLWLPVLAPDLPVPVPVPIRVGRPGLGYPWSWSIIDWIEGEAIGTRDIDQDQLGTDIGGALASLHRPAPADAPQNEYRGIPLRGRAEITARGIESLGDDASFESDAIDRTWQKLLAAPEWDGPALWLHGDLHPLNILEHGGQLAALIDFGDICSGDPATDLAVGFMVFDDGRRQRFFAAAANEHRATDQPMIDRAAGWALALGIVYVANSADNPTMEQIGRRTIASVPRSYIDS